MKEAVALAALEWVKALPSDNLVLGIGTGSTAECFIRLLPACLALSALKPMLTRVAISGSKTSCRRLYSVGDLNAERTAYRCLH